MARAPVTRAVAPRAWSVRRMANAPATPTVAEPGWRVAAMATADCRLAVFAASTVIAVQGTASTTSAPIGQTPAAVQRATHRPTAVRVIFAVAIWLSSHAATCVAARQRPRAMYSRDSASTSRAGGACAARRKWQGSSRRCREWVALKGTRPAQGRMTRSRPTRPHRGWLARTFMACRSKMGTSEGANPQEGQQAFRYSRSRPA